MLSTNFINYKNNQILKQTRKQKNTINKINKNIYKS